MALSSALIIAWVAVRFAAPALLGWPVVTCRPEATPPAQCPDSVNEATSPPLWFLLPMTEVSIDGYGECQSTVRIRYLGGFETTTHWIC